MSNEKVEHLFYDYIFGFIPAEERNKAQFRYFVAHAYDQPFASDLRRIVRQAFEPDLVPYFADEELEPRHILIKIARRIYTTRFGIFDLSKLSPSVFIELGIAFGANKPILPIVKSDSKINIPEWLGNLDILEYSNFGELSEKLRTCRVPSSMISEPEKSSQSICNFCQKICTGRNHSVKSKYYLVFDISTNNDFDKDFRKAVQEGLSSTGLKARTMKLNFSEPWPLCQIAREINGAEFTVFRIDKGVDPIVFWGFGASLGFRIPPVLLVSSQIPSTTKAAMLQGWDCHVYNSYSEVKEYLSHQSVALLDEVNSIKIPQDYWEFGEYKVKVLRDINDIVHRDMTFEDRIQGVLILTLYALRTDAGSIMLVNQANKELVIKALVSSNATLMDVGTWRAFNYGEGIAGWVWENKLPCRVPSIHEDKRYIEKTFDPNLKSLICVPIIFDDNVIGVINCDSEREDHFRDDDEEFLEQISKLVAPVIYQEYIRGSFDTHSKIIEPETTVQRLFRDPICLRCGHEIRLRFVRKKDQKGLRYRLNIACDYCGTEDLVRTYTL